MKWRVWDKKHIQINDERTIDWAEKIVDRLEEEPNGACTFARSQDRLIMGTKNENGDIILFNCQIQAIGGYKMIEVEIGGEPEKTSLKLVD